MGERVTVRNTNSDVKGTWECPEGAVELLRGLGWVPVTETSETDSVEPSARKSRKDTN